MKLLILSREDVASLLDMQTAIKLVDNAMRSLSLRETSQIVRRILPLPGSDGALGDMPGSLGTGKPFGLKCVAAFPFSKRGQSSHRGAVLLFDPSSGEPAAIIEAGLLTAIRTAAATASATSYLARSDARVLGLIGTGEQAHWHARALVLVRPFQRILVWGRDRAKAALFAEAVQDAHGVPCKAVDKAAEAASADVICTLTSASEPVLRGEWLYAGAHVNLVGSSSVTPCEADELCVARSRYFVDWEESARAQASEFHRALNANVISDTHMLGEIGAVAVGRIAGRRDHREITLYKSLGVIVQDLVCAWHLYERAVAQRIGQRADF